MAEDIKNPEEEKKSASGLFTPDEESIIEFTRRIRLDTIKAMTNDGLKMPENVGNIRVLNELVNSLDKQVVDIATIKVKLEAVDNQAKYIEIAQAALNTVDKNAKPRANLEVALPDDIIDVEIVPGHLETEPANLNIKDFVLGDDDV